MQCFRLLFQFEGGAAETHHLVCRYMQGVENSSPNLPKYAFAWDTGMVIRYYKSVTIEENNLLKQLQKVLLYLQFRVEKKQEKPYG